MHAGTGWSSQGHTRGTTNAGRHQLDVDGDTSQQSPPILAAFPYWRGRSLPVLPRAISVARSFARCAERSGDQHFGKSAGALSVSIHANCFLTSPALAEPQPPQRPRHRRYPGVATSIRVIHSYANVHHFRRFRRPGRQARVRFRRDQAGRRERRCQHHMRVRRHS